MTLPFTIDGHNDVLSKIAGSNAPDPLALFDTGTQDWHLDRPRMTAGGVLGGFFAIWGPSEHDATDYDGLMSQPEYDAPLPDALPQEVAMQRSVMLASYLIQLEERGSLRICRNAAELKRSCETGEIGAIMHMEGAEAIGPDLLALDLFYAAGLRSLGPVWSRNNIFCDGVPFRFPASPDTGGGLTEAGRALVVRCNELGVLVDLSHMTEAGFWDVAKTSNAPLVATHSCVHAICPHTRNLTDAQLRTIADRGGVVGLNYAAQFLRPDGRRDPDIPLEQVLAHLDHMIDVMGEDCVALGSDYDGATVPRPIDGVEKIPALLSTMEAHGYKQDRITKIANANWLRVLADTWGG
ncbi:dipeptidase [Ruegeria sp.]|uniref:dipeptidase n=1 Tax=Ruegeria sp. TaxID=1879320 RepID=UPI003C7999E4